MLSYACWPLGRHYGVLPYCSFSRRPPRRSRSKRDIGLGFTMLITQVLGWSLIAAAWLPRGQERYYRIFIQSRYGPTVKSGSHQRPIQILIGNASKAHQKPPQNSLNPQQKGAGNSPKNHENHTKNLARTQKKKLSKNPSQHQTNKRSSKSREKVPGTLAETRQRSSNKPSCSNKSPRG